MSGDWLDLALCAEIGGDQWYPEKEEDGGTAEPAKAMCRRCESRLPCLEDALQRPGEEGVWGGFSERVRRRIIAVRHAAGESLEDIIAEDDAAHYARMEAREATGATPEERRLAAERRRREAKREALNHNQQPREAAA